MPIRYANLNELSAWKKLSALPVPKVAALLNANRVEQSEIAAGGGLSYNFAAKVLSAEMLSVLQDVANEAQLAEKYQALYEGEFMNTGEKRMVLHHMVRGQLGKPVIHNGRDMRSFYLGEQYKAADFARQVRAGHIVSTSGKSYQTIVQIGIGGSDLGPRALYLAMLGFARAQKQQIIPARFLSNVDPDDAAGVLDGLDPATTLFVLVSKSGTTQETLANEIMATEWLSAAGIPEPKKNIAAVTSETSPLALSSDYAASFFIDDFIGGRYSATSCVGGVVLSLAFGPDLFTELLAGAAEADKAAANPKIAENAAMLDALIGVIERNLLGYPSTAVLPYCQALHRFPAHLQQLDMESNGKQVNRFGQPISYSTGPVVFGESGTNGQHSFYQLLHQGTDIIPLQFIGFRDAQDSMDTVVDGSTSLQKLNANLAAQIVAFAKGHAADDRNRNFPGGRPSSLLHAERLTPRVLGALLAHFENKVMFQGFVWNVNSFDQEGVQLGKILTGQLLKRLSTDPVLMAYWHLLGGK